MIQDLAIKIIQVKATTKILQLHVSTNESINVNDMLVLEYNGNSYYFRPTEVSINASETTAILKERGYWARYLCRKKDVNYKDLIGLSLSIVTDEETIRKIDNENSFL